MPSFKEIESGNITSYYTGGIKVFLESSDDLYIFQNIWFSDVLDKVRFESVSDEEGASGGCHKVVKAVDESNRQDISAFGVVDRDSLFSDQSPSKEIFWETDDDEFRRKQPFGDRVHVLRRWEIENYLLKPEAISKIVSDLQLREISSDDVVVEIASIEDDLVFLSAMVLHCVANKKVTPSDKFGSGKEGVDLKEVIERHLCVQSEGLEGEIDKIRSFADNKLGHERWDSLNRVLDGKRCLNRLKDLLNINFRNNEERGFLATAVKNLDLIDGELKEFIRKLH